MNPASQIPGTIQSLTVIFDGSPAGVTVAFEKSTDAVADPPADPVVPVVTVAVFTRVEASGSIAS